MSQMNASLRQVLEIHAAAGNLVALNHAASQAGVQVPLHLLELAEQLHAAKARIDPRHNPGEVGDGHP